MPEADLLDRFKDIVGVGGWLDPNQDLSRYTVENRDIYVGVTPLVLRPNATQTVAQIVALAAQTGTAIVPQGGHTGHSGGAVPDESGDQIIISMERMNRIEEIDPVGKTAVVEAGVVLGQLQQAAAERDCLFPMSLGSQGSCQIGGNISTNAGGTSVLAYGNMRDLVLGLEVVLPNGEVWDGMRRLKKDNTGYSLKNLFIGAEGTLGIVTRAVVKLFAIPRGCEMAFIGLASPQKALKLFNAAQTGAGSALTAFELIHRTPLEFLLRHGQGVRDPLAQPHSWYVLCEISSSRSQSDARDLIESLLGEALETGLIEDAVIAQSAAQRAHFWDMRETMPGTQKQEGASIKHDISVAVHRIPELIERGTEILRREAPDARPCIFGHMGDGNLHYNVSQPKGGDGKAFVAQRERINSLIHELVVEMDGSISAEHGIGRLKRDLMAQTKSPVEMALMRSIKATLDPQGIMNPGKVV